MLQSDKLVPKCLCTTEEWTYHLESLGGMWVDDVQGRDHGVVSTFIASRLFWTLIYIKPRLKKHTSQHPFKWCLTKESVTFVRIHLRFPLLFKRVLYSFIALYVHKIIYVKYVCVCVYTHKSLGIYQCLLLPIQDVSDPFWWCVMHRVNPPNRILVGVQHIQGPMFATK